MGERPCTVRKYASTLKTSAIFVASLAGLWLGIIGQVSASTESDRWVAPIPSAKDCITGDKHIVSRWYEIYMKYERLESYMGLNYTYTIDEFKNDMNSVLMSPELINCKDSAYGRSIALWAVPNGPSVETAKWAASKGIDLTIRDLQLGRTAYEFALDYAEYFRSMGDHVRSEKFSQMVTILKPPPAAATSLCAEVDGQTPPANEYCIVAENTQESFASRLLIPIFDGYQHVTTAKASGIGFFKDWRSTITLDCRAPAGEVCGPLDYTVDDSWPEEYTQQVKDDFGLYIRCGDSINLLDVDTIEAGKSVSIDMHQGWVNYPYSNSCKAHSSQPFTLSIKTTRLAR